jgi:peroxiredoxin
MKQILTLLSLIFFVTFSYTQKEEGNLLDNKKVPAVNLKDLKGKTYNTANLGLKGPVVISFWATWCAPCKKELNAIHDLYEEWQAETGVKIIAVSIDDQRSVLRVAPYVSSVMWPYEILLDSNKQFAQALGVNNVPHTFLVDCTGKIVWQHNNYAEGDEAEVHEQLLKLKK